ncbi:hypothetical protein SAMN05421819_4455 [Bryocella elongata]|uniref:Uncharacterized protein n=1 Tax=Bryocella elongata TaxID=863522 RepID=A0A1H6CE06_9BACT|nr:hypothetical protein [Bryocella elongata]SEG71102.1 hypothetical protein SAMN05421819_4455 [Bryocella elongata]
MVCVDPSVHPLTAFMLGRYVSSCEDPINFPEDEVSAILDRYEVLFANVLTALRLTKEQLRRKSEFNFSSCDAANLEGGIAILRVVEALRLRGFTELTLVAPIKGQQGADITAMFAGIKVCVEVKAVTKQSRGREELFFEDQLYEKVREHATKASRQLAISAEQLHCEVKLIAYVVNWFAQSIYLMESDYQQIVNKLEKHGDVESLDGVDGVLFITKMGQEFLFLNEVGKRIDVAPRS